MGLVAERNSEAADRLIDAILEKARFHANFPNTGRARDDIRLGVWSSSVPPYVILFQAVEDTIEVLRILYGSRDIEKIMAQED